jgi:K+-sensing histidine kinase KdpD
MGRARRADSGLPFRPAQACTAAGHGTDTLPSADIRCLPLKSARGVVGILGVKPIHVSSLLTADQRDLLQAFASQAAMAIERVQLAEQAQPPPDLATPTQSPARATG